MSETLVQLVKNFVYEILLVKPADAEDSWSNNPNEALPGNGMVVHHNTGM